MMQYKRVSEDTVIEALQFIDPDDYGTWLSVGMALKSGDYDIDLWDAWSRKSEKYKQGDCAKKWRSFKRNSGRTIGTLFYLAKLKGFSFKGKCIPSYAYSMPEAPDPAEHDEPLPDEYILPDMTDQIREAHEALLKNPTALKHYQDRGFSMNTIKRYQLGYSEKGLNAFLPEKNRISGSGYYKYILPFPDENDQCRYVCAEIDNRDRKKRNGSSFGKYNKPGSCVQPILNSRYFTDESMKLFFIVEGFYDALALEEIGFPALSLFGVGHSELINDLKRYNVPHDVIFIVSLDGDKTGKQNSETLKADSEQHGYFSIIHHFEGGKDANESLLKDRQGFIQEAKATAEKALNASGEWLKQYEKETQLKRLREFHRWSAPDKNGNSKPIDIIDNSVAEAIVQNHHMFLLNQKLYLYESGVYRPDLDDVAFKTLAKQYIYPELINDNRLTRIIKLLKAERSIRIEDPDLNCYPSHWICFQNGFLDLRSMQMYPHDPRYHNTSMIPHKWDPEHDPSGSVTVQYLTSFFKDPDDLEMFLEFVGYSMTPDMSQQKLMILTGQGNLGKSVLLRLTEKAIGRDNISNLTLQNLNDRFSPAFLYGKILNIFADLSSEDMSNTAGIKTITGGDSVRAEYKGGAVFSFKPISKLMFSANRIPKSRDERSSAYYRRLLIIRFTERAPEIPDLENKLSADIDSFITMAVRSAHTMYTRGRILESENSQKEVEELYMQTDSAQAFLHDCCDIGEGKETDRTKLFEAYKCYCYSEDRERGCLTKNSFYDALRQKGFSEKYSHGYRLFDRIGLKPIAQEIMNRYQ